MLDVVSMPVLAAERFARAGRQKGDRSGPLGAVALEVLRDLVRLIDYRTPGFYLSLDENGGQVTVYKSVLTMDSKSASSVMSEIRKLWEASMHFVVNGDEVDLDFDTRTSLLDLLREKLHVFGPKKGCNQGACGACTVLVDGERINSCLALAVQYQGREITTVEGLGSLGALHPLQNAFIEHDGFQCGYCTPGQICSTVAMAAELERGVPSYVSSDVSAAGFDLTGEEVRERMSGNLCRCGAYNGIVDAIQDTYGEVKTADPYKREAA